MGVGQRIPEHRFFKRNIVAICVEPLSALATVAGDLSTNGLEFLAFGSLGLPAGG